VNSFSAANGSRRVLSNSSALLFFANAVAAADATAFVMRDPRRHVRSGAGHSLIVKANGRVKLNASLA
jgi:hypothetical protein